MKIKSVVLSFIFFASFVFISYGNYPRLDMKYLMPLLKNGKTDEAMNYLKDHLKDNSKEIRSGVYSVLSSVFDRNPNYRKEIVEIWSSHLHDIYGNRVLYECLYDASPAYYTEISKRNLIDSFERKDGRLYRTILLLGHANVREAISKIKEILEKAQGEHRERNFVYHEALARMGDKDEIKYCLKYFDEEIKNNNAKYNKEKKYSFNAYADLCHAANAQKYAYIRQPGTVAMLKKLLLIKDKKDIKPPDRQLSKYAFDSLVKCLMVDDVIEKDRFGHFVPNKENIELLRKWMKEHYTPQKIKSLSVLINGQIVNNYASSSAVTETDHTARPVKRIKPEVQKAETKTAPRVKTTPLDISSVAIEKSNKLKYLYIVILCLGAVFLIVMIKRKKS